MLPLLSLPIDAPKRKFGDEADLITNVRLEEMERNSEPPRDCIVIKFTPKHASPGDDPVTYLFLREKMARAHLSMMIHDSTLSPGKYLEDKTKFDEMAKENHVYYLLTQMHETYPGDKLRQVRYLLQELDGDKFELDVLNALLKKIIDDKDEKFQKVFWKLVDHYQEKLPMYWYLDNVRQLPEEKVHQAWKFIVGPRSFFTDEVRLDILPPLGLSPPEEKRKDGEPSLSDSSESESERESESES